MRQSLLGSAGDHQDVSYMLPLLQLQLADVQMINDDIYVYPSPPPLFTSFNYLYLAGPMTTRRRLNRTLLLLLRLRNQHISFPSRITGRAFAKAEGQKNKKSFVKLGIILSNVGLSSYNDIRGGGTANYFLL
jgi:hypothetical protein